MTSNNSAPFWTLMRRSEESWDSISQRAESMTITHKESLWTLVRSAVHTWWNQRNTPPSTPVPPSSPNESPSPTENPKPSPLIGWRAWVAKLDETGAFMLWSPIYATLWPGPTLRLPHIPLDDHLFYQVAIGWGATTIMRAPDTRCGLHAARERKTVTVYRVDKDVFRGDAFEPRWLDHWYPVIGQVECFGGIAEHDDGWRAQAMTIQRLIIFTDDARLKADLEARYQCEVEVEQPDHL